MKYHFRIHKADDGYSAQGIELEGCFTQGDTLEELYENMQDALNTYIEEPNDSKDFAPLPDETIRCTKNIVEVPVDPQVAIAFQIRRYRIEHGLTQKQAAQRMGFDNIYSYQRLESKKSNPSLKILSKLKEVFPELSIDKAFK